MKSLNENWFVITLTAVVFGLIGFLIGKQNQHGQCPMMSNTPHVKHMEKMKGAEIMMWIANDHMMTTEEEGVEIDIDTLNLKGKKQIKVVVKKENN